MTEDENKYNPFARAAEKNGIKTFKPHPLSKIKKTIAVISGKGGVGKSMVTSLYSQVIFDELDVLLIDMPPGTGDVPLTVFQSIPVDGAIVVSSPQDLVSMVVKKSITMAGMMHINVLGVIENMAYITCPDCGKKIKIFGETPLDCLAAMMGANLIDELPMDGKLAALVDQGKLEDYEGDYLSKAVEAIKKL